jgi:UDP-N-acetylglucosamine diphosphorylase/glucosamine-1-phosphate N-acetyltransferase
MRLILVDRFEEIRRNFYPIALNRPLWELRCGISSLGEKLIDKTGASDVAYFVPDYMAEAYQAKVKHPVNDLSILNENDLLIVDPLVKCQDCSTAILAVKTRHGQDGREDQTRPGWPCYKSGVGLDQEGRILYARVTSGELKGTVVNDVVEFLEAARAKLPNVLCTLKTWRYIWELILANAEQITEDFVAAGQNGIEGIVEQPSAIRGGKKDVYIGPGAVVHPMVVIDAEYGPVYIDQGVQIQPFSRIEGPCYIGKDSILTGANCRAGNSIGPVCRIGGEVEGSIIHGYSNKYHDGFIGHSYIGEWVNLGALTTNSDLKNDYSTVSIMLDGRRSIDTGSTKVGSLIGDHAKTSIGTLLNTGSYVGAMTIILATGKPLPKFIPSFGWFVEGIVTKGFGKARLFETAKIVMGRRGCKWSAAEQSMWEAVYAITAQQREIAIEKGRRALSR